MKWLPILFLRLDVFWWLLVVSEILPFVVLANRSKSTFYKILYHETKFLLDKNGTKPQENKAKTSLFRISLSEYPYSEYKGTNLSRNKRTNEPISLIHNALFHNLVPRQILQGFRYIISYPTVK